MVLISIHGKKGQIVAQILCCKKHNSINNQFIILFLISMGTTSLHVCILPSKNVNCCCVSAILSVMEHTQKQMFTPTTLSFKKLLACPR